MCCGRWKSPGTKLSPLASTGSTVEGQWWSCPGPCLHWAKITLPWKAALCLFLLDQCPTKHPGHPPYPNLISDTSSFHKENNQAKGQSSNFAFLSFPPSLPSFFTFSWPCDVYCDMPGTISHSKDWNSLSPWISALQRHMSAFWKNLETSP